MSIRILAIDTTTEACSVALMLNKNIIFNNFIIAPKKHTQHILPMIDKLLSKAGITLKNINALAFNYGPGNFTGIRISIGIIQGLALGANLPIIGVSSLEILAEGAWRHTNISNILTAINVHMQKVYWAPYQRKESGIWMGNKLEKFTEILKFKTHLNNFQGCWAIAGTGWKLIKLNSIKNKNLHFINGKILLPNAQDILPLALNYYKVGNFKPITLIKPHYLQYISWKK
ncbi:tRNA threonylcarbamoyladenosine biosynthesis protein TsaB [Candidatus Mikella endobia]|uniref:tRNA threonylcarbamoyladenosine biosynthesis protein TsaB n=1 Tax=Candidatus Mikella endobia TaxID=1778264 RepID=A0A143WPZ0_9ENTR|nr:tRNA (adenosine(37)-N6)-threonylcarbamoyltransferase complex dimerization subunit type 1 TsaB [Candidatus Mikella endobia]CUX95804.1 tRNA threonylcarbamoyladenosine biosynthesis protein TsaB [Candidatus Mikella endobia]